MNTVPFLDGDRVPSEGCDSLRWSSSCGSKEVQDAWAEWVAGLGEWHVFGGLTYDQRRSRSSLQAPGVRPGADVVKHHAMWWIKEHNKLYPGRQVEAGIMALEYQKNGWPHLHPLLRLGGGLVEGDIRRLGTLWFGRFGGNRLEAPRSTNDVAAYAAKYLVKDLASGDVLFWPLRGSLSVHQPELSG